MVVIDVFSPSAGVEDVVLPASLSDARGVVVEFDPAAESHRCSWTGSPATMASPRGGRT